MIIRHLVCIVLFFLKCLSTGLIKHVNYCKIPKISSGACIFQRPFLRGLSTKGNLLFKIDWASLIVENLPFFLCFTLYLRAISKYKPPGGLIFGRAISRRVFCVTSLGGLYMEGLIFGILRYFLKLPKRNSANHLIFQPEFRLSYVNGKHP